MNSQLLYEAYLEVFGGDVSFKKLPQDEQKQWTFLLTLYERNREDKELEHALIFSTEDISK